MRVYFIYLVRPSITPSEYPAVDKTKVVRKNEFDCALYAFTDVKERMEYFRHTRQMKYFSVVERKMSKEEFLDLMCDEDLVSYNLEPRSIISETITSSNAFTSSYIDVLMTAREFTHIFEHQDEIFSYITSDYDFILLNKIPSSLFRKKYTDALEMAISYTEMMMPEENLTDELPWYPKKYNLLSLYCNQFKNTYREGFDVTCEYGSFLRNRKKEKKYPIR